MSSNGSVPPSPPLEGLALLDTIAGTESPGYDVLYTNGSSFRRLGGLRRFKDFSRHPNDPDLIETGPNKGRYSTAAGRYQFIKRTWDTQAARLHLQDFGPRSQDLAAWDLAEREYRRITKRSLAEDLKDAARRGAIGRALSGLWTSLPSGIETSTSASRFAMEYQRNLDRRRAEAGD